MTRVRKRVNTTVIKDAMKRKRFSILILFMILAIAFSAAALSACNDNTSGEDDATIEATEGLLISNSDFKVIGTTGDYPHTVTDWTGAKLYSSSTVPGDVTSGAVSLEEALYSASRELWGDDGAADSAGKTLYDRLIADGGQGGHLSDAEDAVNNVLMIYMPTEDAAEDDEDDFGPTAYGYTSKSFSIEAGSYYKLSVDVLTYNIAGTEDVDNVPGARIYVSSAGYAEISGIDTEGEWKTYTLYIEGAATSATSLTLNLGLGKYSSYYRDGLTTGYAFFDNVVLEKIDGDDVTAEAAKAEFDEACAEELTAYGEIRTAWQSEMNNAEEDDKDEVLSLAARYSAMSTRTMTLRTSNGRFDFGSTTVGTGAPSGWSLVTGDGAPTSYRFNGIVSASRFEENVSTYAGTYYIDRTAFTPSSVWLPDIYDDMTAHIGSSIGDSLYMLSQQMMTAQGIRTSRQIVIEKNGLYKLQISVLTHNVYGGGVSLILSGDGEDIVIEGISENKYDGKVLFGNRPVDASVPAENGWETYTFYIRGNEYKDMSYNLTLWLGTGSAEENTESDYTYYSSSSTSSSGSTRTTYLANGTFASGWAFFDDLSLTQYAADDADDFETAVSGMSSSYELNAAEGDAKTLYTDLSLASENLFEDESAPAGGIHRDFRAEESSDFEFAGDTLGRPAGWDFKAPEADEAASAPVVTGRVTAGTVDLTDEEYYTALGLSVPGLPYEGATMPETGMTIRATENVAFAMKSGEFTVRANSAYTVSVWVKTDGIETGKGAYLYLKGYDDEGEETTLASFTAVNTANDDGSEWTEYTFYVKGSDEGAEQLWLEFALGTGTRWSASTLTDGAVYFANISMLNITYSDFSSASAGTYVKKTDLSSGSVEGSFPNGSFGNIDYDELEDDLTEAVSAAETAADGAEGTLQESSVAGVPEDWTLSDATLSDNDKFVGGVLKLAESANGAWGASNQIKHLFPDDVDFFDSIYTDAPDTAKGAPYLLALAGLGESFSVGYLSDSFTLEASTNYSISVWARAKSGTSAMIFLQGEASGKLVGEDADTARYFTVIPDGAWHKYTFNIEVGLTDISLQLGLWLGDNTDISGNEYDTEDGGASSGIVLFDSVTMHEGLEEDDINDYAASAPEYEEVKHITFFTDSFDTLESDSATVDEEGNNILTSPNGWTGTVGTDQEKENTTPGVFDASDPTSNLMGPEPEEGEEDQRIAYITGIGPELDPDDFSASDEEIRLWLADNGGSADNDEDVDRAREAIKLDKYYKAIAARMLPEDIASKVYEGADGDKVLLINNTVDSAYRYGSSGYTLAAETAYMITVRVFTYGIGHVDENGVWTAADDRGAYIELYLGSADDDDNPLHFYDIDTENGWKTYTFVVLAPADDVTSVSLRLGLGRYDADDESLLVSGYAFFDAVTIEEIGGENEYDAAKEAFPAEGEEGYGTYASYIIPEDAEKGATDDDDDTTDVPGSSFNLDSLWWMIPTIVIGLAIIAVVIVYFVRKYKKKFTKKSEEPTDSISSTNVRKKKDDYDSFNE